MTDTSIYEAEAEQDAIANNVDPTLYAGLIQAESGFNPGAYNASSGATGIAQFLPSTAANPGYGIAAFDPTNADASLEAGAEYLAAMIGATGSNSGGLDAYNSGLGAAAVGAGNSYPASLNDIATNLDNENPAAINAEDVANNPATPPAAPGTSLFASIGLRIAFALLSIMLVGIGLVALIKQKPPGQLILEKIKS